MTPTDPQYSAPTRIVSPTLPKYIDLRMQDPFRPAPRLRLVNLSSVFKSLFSSLRFLAETEVHVYCFAVSVNVLISFYPFVVAMILICLHFFHWPAAANVVIQTVKDYFPGDFGMDIAGYLKYSAHQRFSWLSVFLLFFTANGIFTPLEVAFNRIWGVKVNRSFLRNQVISLGLIFVCGILVLGSACLDTVFGASLGSGAFAALVQNILLHLIALPVTIVMIFLIYWLLPNAEIPIGRLLPSAIVVAVLIQVAEFANVLLWPWLRDKLRADVPPFVQSISIIFWAFVATMIILAGAEWAARGRGDTHPQDYIQDEPEFS
jgi:uncharacterized BrkB/YihY/UPF0761 family membrane protein